MPPLVHCYVPNMVGSGRSDKYILGKWVGLIQACALGFWEQALSSAIHTLFDLALGVTVPCQIKWG